MLLIFCALGAVGLLFSSVDAVSCPIGHARETQTTLREAWEDVYVKPVPTTVRGKCLLDCILNFTGLLKEDGLINAEKFLDRLNQNRKFYSLNDTTLENIKTATNNCRAHKHLSENKCATAALFLQCSSEEIEKLRSDPQIMSRAISVVYRSMGGEVYPKKEGYYLFDWPEIDWLPRGKPKNKPIY